MPTKSRGTGAGRRVPFLRDLATLGLRNPTRIQVSQVKVLGNHKPSEGAVPLELICLGRTGSVTSLLRVGFSGTFEESYLDTGGVPLLEPG